MFPRILKPSRTTSFFIFGARGTGKTSFLRAHFEKNSHFINLLEARWETRYLKDPDRLRNDIEALDKRPAWIIIDEVQKIPKLLDIVHSLIEEKNLKFILTGSSARKLKRGTANLLAGRAFFHEMFPLTFIELGDKFDLDFVLHWGSMPKIFSLKKSDRVEYLRSYAQTYLKEEILQEQLVRNGLAFRNFLEVSAQENGKTLNFRKIGRDIGIDTKTVQSFFQILEDTLVGFVLPAYHRSVRKSVKQQPKFYLFDLGVKKALEHTLEDTLSPRTAGFGAAFEHFVICEAYRLNRYYQREYQLAHYQTSAGGEIDLILHRGRKIIAVEIKSRDRIDEIQVLQMGRISEALQPSLRLLVSRDPTSTQIGDVTCWPWDKFLRKVFVDAEV